MRILSVLFLGFIMAVAGFSQDAPPPNGDKDMGPPPQGGEMPNNVFFFLKDLDNALISKPRLSPRGPESEKLKDWLFSLKKLTGKALFSPKLPEDGEALLSSRLLAEVDRQSELRLEEMKNNRPNDKAPDGGKHPDQGPPDKKEMEKHFKADLNKTIDAVLTKLEK